MAKPKDEAPLTILCPKCRQTIEPDFNETTNRFVCPICVSPVDARDEPMKLAEQMRAQTTTVKTLKQ